MFNKTYFCLHGHFYQPPRENPWTEEIDLQPGASPFHDWNELIYSECYKPNTEAKIFNKEGQVVDVVNNFEYLNFNVGPTLFGWIKKKHYNTYLKIIEADKKSFNQNGHGNAIAQVYNHIIMPLANKHDKITQVKWGLYDFEYNFGRKSEGIWLSETACNYETIEVLADEGIKYIILDPSQADSVRSFDEKNWINLNENHLDTSKTYRCYTNESKSKYIDIFFYNGYLAKSMAFDNLLFNAQDIILAIKNFISTNNKSNQLISIATDGETFGHHKKFTEMTLAYLFKVELPKNNIKTTNFGKYLAFNPPNFEVRLKRGLNNEGTSWSCLHGVGRWKEDCGCSMGELGWNQKWRRALREALDWLRDEVIKLYVQEGNKYFKNIWKARNEYISIIIDRSQEKTERFFYFNAIEYLNEKQTTYCLKLLELQKLSMYMYTSCAWFFSDISRIEAQQILLYSIKALELVEELFNISLEENFLNILAKAKSNIKEYQNGKYIYQILKSTRTHI